MEDLSPMSRLALLYGTPLTDCLVLVPSSSSMREPHLYTLKTEEEGPVGYADVEDGTGALVFCDLDGVEVWRAVPRQTKGGSLFGCSSSSFLDSCV